MAIDPVQFLRTMLARKASMAGHNPLGQVAYGGADDLSGAMPTADQIFNPTALMGRGSRMQQPAPLSMPQAQAPTQQTFAPPQVAPPPQAALAPARPQGSPAPQAPTRQAPQAPQAPMLNQGPVGPTAFEDRMNGVQDAISAGTFDPAGANSTTFAPGIVGSGPTPIHRFLDAAAQHAGLKFDVNKSPDAQFFDSLGPEGMGKRINKKNFDTMLENTPESTNVEDRRGERTWRNKPVEQWNPTDKADFQSASETEKTQYLTSMIEGAMGNRENYAPEYQADPGRSNQEAQQ